MSARLIAAGGAATALRHARRASARAALPRYAPVARPLYTGPRPTPSTGLATAARWQPAREGGGQGGGHAGRGGATATAAAAVAVAAAAAAAGVVVVGSARQEDNGLVLAAEAYSIPIGRAYPDVCNCFIEVSRESRMKYEWDEETNMLKLDRVLHGAAFYPHDYGFIPQTLCGDGDPLDVLVLGTSALQPGAIVDIRPLGYMVMEDEKGLDEKVLAVPDKDPRFNHMKSLRDVPEHVLREITNFFETYKQLEKSKWVKVGGWKGSMDTHDLIEQTHKTYLASKRKQKKDAKK